MNDGSRPENASFPRSRVGTFFVPLRGVLAVNPRTYRRPIPRSHAPAWERSSCRSAACSRSIPELLANPFQSGPSGHAGYASSSALLLRQIFLRNRLARPFAVPKDCDRPPSLPVKEKLNAVDSARERLRIFERVP
jgi:hypothetical protein